MRKLNILRFDDNPPRKYPIEVKKTFTYMGHDFFVHRPPQYIETTDPSTKRIYKIWVVSEKTTGYSIGAQGHTINSAIETAKKKLNIKGKEALETAIAKSIENHGKAN